jgi:choline dehydrogenase-like flavoprotein
MNAFDVIVVGSGAGGAAAANRTCAAGLRTLLLEKGHQLPTDGSTLDIERVVHRGEFLSREMWRDGAGRAFAPEEHFNVGGKTRWYGAALLRFDPREFLPDAHHQCRGWPIGYYDLEPYYREAETLLGVRQIPIEPALARIVDRISRAPSDWHAMPIPMSLATDICSDRHEAAHFDGFASVRALKHDAANSLLERASATGRLTLRTGAEATDLLARMNTDAEIDGVRCADGSEWRAPIVILAAGALHSPRILRRYLEGQRANGRNRQGLPALEQVGANLKLHLLTAMVAVGVARNDDLIRKTTVLLNDHFAHSSVQPLGFDAELIATLIPRIVPRSLARQVGRRAYGFFLQTEDGSSIRNRVDERESRDGSARSLDYDARRTPAAADEHVAFTRALQRALLRAGLVSFTKRIGLSGTAHVCGTLIAGQSPSDSVVDPSGRVHGIEGLYVADGSVLPRSSRVNPSLTIYAWGLRVGDTVARAHRAGAIEPAPIAYAD